MKTPPPAVCTNSARTWFSFSAFFYLISSVVFGDLVALSSRHDLGSSDSDNTVYVEFEIAATTDVLFRHAGPALAGFGVPNALTDAALQLYDASDQLIGSNDNWSDAANATEIETASDAVGGFPLEPDSQDAALLMTLEPGNYRLKAFSDSAATGLSLSEVYVVPSGGESFKTMSVEAFGAATTSGRLLPGFITASGPSSILIRVSGVGIDADPDPSITAYSAGVGGQQTIIASNDDWEDGSEAALINPLASAVGLNPLLISGSTDSAVLLARLDSGVYTVLNSSSGRVRVDIADVTAEFEQILDPLIGGTPLPGAEGWFHSDWFGYYGTMFAPWLLHIEHGAIYRDPDSTNASMYVYDDAMGAWWWTNESIYPFIYVFDPPVDIGGTDIEAEWLWYSRGTEAPRSFAIVTGPQAGEFLFYDP